MPTLRHFMTSSISYYPVISYDSKGTFILFDLFMVSLDKLDCAIVARRSLLELVYCLHDGHRCVLGPLTTHIPEIIGHLHVHMMSDQGSSQNTDIDGTQT